MKTLAIFNPEHDLCLANGNPHFVPPSSALMFARRASRLMFYLDESSISETVDASEAPAAYFRLSNDGDDVRLMAWGWNEVLRNHLLKSGIPPNILPSENSVAVIRQLSHRTTALPLQPDTQQLFSIQEVEAMLSAQHRILLKAPWSGAGRGLHWVDERLTPQDSNWVLKTIAHQGSVMAEPRCDVVQDFAFLFLSFGDGCVSFVGYSLFETRNGVYQRNWLKEDAEIENHLSQWILQAELTQARHTLQEWLTSLTLSTKYQGPIGVDAFVYRNGCRYSLKTCVEINFRYTMGFVAHERLRRNPDMKNSFWSPMEYK